MVSTTDIFKRLGLTLSHKGFVIVCLPLCVELVFVAVLMLLLLRVELEDGRKTQATAVINNAEEVLQLISNAGSCLATYSVSKNKIWQENYRQAVSQIPPQLQELKALLVSQSQAQDFQLLERTTAKTIALFERINSSSSGSTGGNAYEELQTSAALVESQLNLLVTKEKQWIAAAEARLRTARDHVYGFVLVGTGLNILLALFMGHLFYTGITGRLRTLTDNTYRLARAEKLNPPLHGDDEIAHLDRVFHDMSHALAEAARKERAVIENALDVICSIDAEGRFSAISPASSDVFGYLPQELVGTKYYDLIVDEDVAVTREIVDSIMAESSIEEFENRVKRKDKTVVYILWSAYWSPSERSMFCVAHDITERKHAENLIIESESRVRSIIERMPVGLMVINGEGFIELINPQTEKMFGYTASELVNKHISMLLPKSQEFQMQHLSGDGLGKMIGRVRELEGLRANADIFPLEFTLEKYSTADGQRYLANMLDVTERHEVERMKREFVSTVSHELRTPLTSIRGSLTLLSVGALGMLPEQADKVVKIAERNSLRLIDLINELLDIEKLDAGKMDMTFEVTALNAVIERAVESVKSFAEQYGITITVNSVTTDSEVMADADRLLQVLINLLSNAIKYSPREDVVTVSVERQKGFVTVKVSDNGRGIPADFQDKVFERFQQVELSDSKRKGGSGLGLAICKSIIEHHRGEIGVISTEGHGSTFWFKIPLVDNTVVVENPRTPPTVIPVTTSEVTEERA